MAVDAELNRQVLVAEGPLDPHEVGLPGVVGMATVASLPHPQAADVATQRHGRNAAAFAIMQDGRSRTSRTGTLYPGDP